MLVLPVSSRGLLNSVTKLPVQFSKAVIFIVAVLSMISQVTLILSRLREKLIPLCGLVIEKPDGKVTLESGALLPVGRSS